MSVSATDFRATMRHTASGVVVISTVDSGEMFGFTANSFTSLSLTPPSVLFCLSNSSRSLSALHQSGKFGVSILSEEQENISKNFATLGIDKFANIDYLIGSESGCPLIKKAICWLECSVKHEYDGGDHRIIVGLVEAVQVNNNSDPLVYYSGNYHNIEKQ